MRSKLVTVGLLALGVALLGVSLAQDNGATYIKNAMCIACHKASDKALVENYQATKHAKVKPAEDATPLDIYRRSVGFKAEDNTFLDAGVLCQSCHGPGSLHSKAKTPEDRQATIVRPQELKTSGEKTSLCGRCHGTYQVGDQPFVASFKPGQDLTKVEGFKLSEVTDHTLFTVWNEFQTSKHGGADVTCITCHTSHGGAEGEHNLRKQAPALCLDCHTTAHVCLVTEIPEGATCVTCHMPGAKHTFSVQQAEGGMM